MFSSGLQDADMSSGCGTTSILWQNHSIGLQRDLSPTVPTEMVPFGGLPLGAQLAMLHAGFPSKAGSVLSPTAFEILPPPPVFFWKSDRALAAISGSKVALQINTFSVEKRPQTKQSNLLKWEKQPVCIVNRLAKVDRTTLQEVLKTSEQNKTKNKQKPQA